MIQRKLKPCKTCKKECYLFSHGNCKDCAMRLKHSENPKEIKPRYTTIAPISKTRCEALKKYRRLRDKYFEENPICEFPECKSKRITLHHKRGRIGAFLTDKRYFCSLCVKHHTWANEHNDEALKMGLVHSRLHD